MNPNPTTAPDTQRPPPPEATPHARALRLRTTAWGITMAYATLAACWIYFSDQALATLIDDPDLLISVSVYKGFGFIVVTSLLLLVLMRLTFRSIEKNYNYLQKHEKEIERLGRLYAALSQINQTIVWSSTREELFSKVCQVLVDFGKFQTAWIGWHNPETRQIELLASHGDDSNYLGSIKVYADERIEGQGPVGRAFREKQPVVCNDYLNDACTRPWQDRARAKGIRAGASFPIRLGGEVVGTLNVYALEKNFFQTPEIELLAEAAGDISFALDNLRREQLRLQAEARAQNEKRFSDTMIESMPGVVYFYDAQGRFLRWNKNFETVSGYSADEIASMHPTDFFDPEQKALLEERIAEVFIKGESSVEAPFLARDGTATPYYFTGRRVQFEGMTCLVGVGVDISERTAAERALQESDHRHRTTLDNILEGCQLISFDWRYLYLNDAAAIHNRRPNSELLGRTMTECWPGIEKSPAYALIDTCLRERKSGQQEIEFHFPDGTRGWFDVRAQPAEEGALVLSIDKTRRKQAESQLAQSEREYRELVEYANSIILRWNAQGVITLLNDFGQRFFGYSAAEILGRNIIGTLVPATDSSGRDMERLMEAISENPIEFERSINENIKRNGERVWISWTNRIVKDKQGKVQEILSIGTDVTEQLKAERAMQELNTVLEERVAERTTELEAARIRAEAADQLKSAFLATMSHELRTPLNSIIGFTGILLQKLAGPLNPEQIKQLSMVRGSARHLLELINDVLDISKIEAGQLDVHAEDFDLASSIRNACSTIQPLLEKKNLTLSTTVPEDLPSLHSDQRRLEQILINLLNNAIKFTPEGEITLTATPVSDYQPRPGAQPIPAIAIAVSDTGIGIKPADLTHLFQPFRQLDTGLTRQHEGTGLGLAICRRLVELLGGTITAHSQWQEGSTFTITLPTKLPPETPPQSE